MFFILQEEVNSVFLDIEFLIVKDLLDKTKYTNEYIIMSLDDFYHIQENTKILKDKKEFDEKFENAIPVGTIQFVSAYLKIFKEIEMENAIEIPPILRKDEFLKRKYSIRKFEEIPHEGRYFIKDATQLKVFSYVGDLEYFFKEQSFNFEHVLDPFHLYQVSEAVNILSEYRVYIISGKIVGIENYDGNPLIFPDINIINKANLLYSTQSDYPSSYSMDVMITERGTAITEIHNFTSIGLYSTIWGTDLLYAYRDGIQYLINHNTKQTEFSNFKDKE